MSTWKPGGATPVGSWTSRQPPTFVRERPPRVATVQAPRDDAGLRGNWPRKKGVGPRQTGKSSSRGDEAPCRTRVAPAPWPACAGQLGQPASPLFPTPYGFSEYTQHVVVAPFHPHPERLDLKNARRIFSVSLALPRLKFQFLTFVFVFIGARACLVDQFGAPETMRTWS